MVCFLIVHLDRIHVKLIEVLFLFNCPWAADYLGRTGVFGSVQCATCVCVLCASLWGVGRSNSCSQMHTWRHLSRSVISLRKERSGLLCDREIGHKSGVCKSGQLVLTLNQWKPVWIPAGCWSSGGNKRNLQIIKSLSLNSISFPFSPPPTLLFLTAEL